MVATAERREAILAASFNCYISWLRRECVRACGWVASAHICFTQRGVIPNSMKTPFFFYAENTNRCEWCSRLHMCMLHYQNKKYIYNIIYITSQISYIHIMIHFILNSRLSRETRLARCETKESSWFSRMEPLGTANGEKISLRKRTLRGGYFIYI